MGDDELDRMRHTDLVDVLRSISGFYPEHVLAGAGRPGEAVPAGRRRVGAGDGAG